jgi:ketosteroid isomerase-like protein
MSQENLELMREVAEAINADEITGDLVAPDCEITNTVTAVTDARYVGPDGARAWRRAFFDVIANARFEGDVVATGDDYVVTINRIVGQGLSSGAPVELRWASVWWFRDRKLTRAIGYPSRHKALEAVGLSE